jgi:hypothetical protein
LVQVEVGNLVWMFGILLRNPVAGIGWQFEMDEIIFDRIVAAFRSRKVEDDYNTA